MNEKNNESNFPIEPKGTGQDSPVTRKFRELEDLTEKDIKYFIRLFDFTPDERLQEKFGLNKKNFNKLVKKLRDEGVELEKSESYSRSVVAIQKNGKIKDGKPITRSHLLSNFLDTVPEEEARNYINLYEEGCDPIDLMKQLITMQGIRAVRGRQLEMNSTTTLHKTVNDCFSDLAVMIVKLHEMQEGAKVIHGFDDSFVGLILQNQKRKNQPDDIIDI